MHRLLYCTLLSYESLFQKSDECDNYVIQKFVKWTHELFGNDYLESYFKVRNRL